MKFKYFFLTKRHIILERLMGVVTLDGVMQSVEYMWQSAEYNKSYSGLMDLREAEVLLSTGELTRLSQFLLNNPSTSEGKWVVLVSKPFETALAMIFESKMALKQQIEIFSEVSSALTALDISREEFDKLDAEEYIVLKPSPEEIQQKKKS